MFFKMDAAKKRQNDYIVLYQPPTIVMLTVMSKISIFKTIGFISYIKIVMYGHSMVHLSWLPL